MVVAINFHQPDFSQPAFLYDGVSRFHQVWSAAPLRPYLHYLPVLARRAQHGLSLRYIHADGLLAIDVGASLDCFNHRQRVPMIWGSDLDNIQILFLQHFAVVAVRPRPLLRRLPGCDHIGALGQHSFIDVAERHHFNRRDLNEPEQIRLAVPASADQPHPPPLLLIESKSRATGSRQCQQEFATVNIRGHQLSHSPCAIRPRMNADARQ